MKEKHTSKENINTYAVNNATHCFSLIFFFSFTLVSDKWSRIHKQLKMLLHSSETLFYSFFSSFSFSSNRCVAWALVYRLQCSNKINKEKHTLQTTKKVIFIMNRLKIKKHDDFQSKIICAVSDFICRVEKGRREKPIFDWFICFEMKKKKPKFIIIHICLGVLSK